MMSYIPHSPCVSDGLAPAVMNRRSFLPSILALW